jgi:hypothetical protein
MERRGKSPPCARAKDFLKLAANAGHEVSRVAFDLDTKPLFDHKHRPFIEPVAQANPPEFDAAVAGMATRNFGSHFSAQFQKTTTELARMSLEVSLDGRVDGESLGTGNWSIEAMGRRSRTKWRQRSGCAGSRHQ